MQKWQKAVVGWGAFILIAIGIANAATPTDTPSSIQATKIQNVVEQATTKATPVVKASPKTVQIKETPSPVKTYVNSRGNTVQSPTYYNSQPSGASAKCRDGTYSFSQSRRGTCSHHGGVDEWL